MHILHFVVSQGTEKEMSGYFNLHSNKDFNECCVLCRFLNFLFVFFFLMLKLFTLCTILFTLTALPEAWFDWTVLW